MSRSSLPLSATAPPSLSSATERSATERTLANIITPQVPRGASGSSVAQTRSNEKPTSKEDLIAQARQLTAGSEYSQIKFIAESLRSIDNKVSPPTWTTSNRSTRQKAMLQSLHDWYGDVPPSVQSRGSPPPLSTGLSGRLDDMTTGKANRKRDSPTIQTTLDVEPPVTRQRSSESGDAEPGVVRQRSIEARAAEIKKRSLASQIFPSRILSSLSGRRDSRE